MDDAKELYRQHMIDQIHAWEGHVAYLNASLPLLEGPARREFDHRLRDLQRCNRIVFLRYKNLLMAHNDDQWEEAQLDLDAAAANMQELLDEFILMPA